MSRILVDLPPQVRSRIGLVSVLGIAPLSFMASRFDLALVFSLLSFAVVISTAVLLHVFRALIRDDWFAAWAILFAGLLVSVTQQILAYFHPGLLQNIAFFLSIIAVNPLVLVQTRIVQRHQTAGSILAEAGKLMSIFFLLMVSTAAIRELLGNGTLTLLPGYDAFRVVVPGLSSHPVSFLLSAAGGMILLGFIVAGAQWLGIRRQSAVAAQSEPESGGAR